MSNTYKNATAGCAYKKGIVAASKPGFAQVRFDDLDGMTTDWLPTSHANTQDDKEVETLNVGTQVSCLMDARMEDGCIVGAHYSDVDTPPVASNSKWCKRFSDGTTIEYDKETHALVIDVQGSINIKATGAVTINGATINLN